jgi:hypothetical protein
VHRAIVRVLTRVVPQVVQLLCLGLVTPLPCFPRVLVQRRIRRRPFPVCGRLFTRESLPDTDMRLNTPTSNHTKSIVPVFLVGYAVLDLLDVLLREPRLKCHLWLVWQDLPLHIRGCDNTRFQVRTGLTPSNFRKELFNYFPWWSTFEVPVPECHLVLRCTRKFSLVKDLV